MSLSPSDAKILGEFGRFMQANKDMLEGHNPNIPVETYLLLACFVLLLFDYFITLDQEVNYVWSSPWSLGLPLFYINRYVPFVDLSFFIHFQLNHMTQDTCDFFVKAATWTIMIPSVFGQLIIVLRTCALWKNNSKIVGSLLLTMLAVVISIGILTAQQMKGMEFAPTPSFIKGCIRFDKSRITLYIYVCLFITESIIIGLTLVKAFYHLRRNRTAWVYQLYQNGIFYCIIILLFSIFNMIIPTTNLAHSYKQSLRVPQHVIHSMLCNRVIFQLFKHRQSLQNLGRSRTTDTGHDTDCEARGTYATRTADILTSIFVDGRDERTFATWTTDDIDETELELDVIDSEKSRPGKNENSPYRTRERGSRVWITGA